MKIQLNIKKMIPEKIKLNIKKIIPIKVYLKYRFPLEYKIINNKKKQYPKSQSVLFFTTQKTASSAVNNLFSYLNTNYLKLDLTDFSNYVYTMSEFDEELTLNQYQNSIFKNKGVLYAPLRDYVNLPNIDEYNVVFFLRDPRDVLVSNYYSLAYSHALPFNQKRLLNFNRVRSEVSNMDIDTFVLNQSDFFFKKYSAYVEHINSGCKYSLLRYEDMIDNPKGWVSDLLQIFGIEPTPLNTLDVISLMDLEEKVKIEDIKSHIRNKKPGDYRNKLKVETIEVLNKQYFNVLLSLGYEI